MLLSGETDWRPLWSMGEVNWEHLSWTGGEAPFCCLQSSFTAVSYPIHLVTVFHSHVPPVEKAHVAGVFGLTTIFFFLNVF